MAKDADNEAARVSQYDLSSIRASVRRPTLLVKAAIHTKNKISDLQQISQNVAACKHKTLLPGLENT